MLRRFRSPAPPPPQADTETAARAVRLVETFETQGIGWFWETDDEGRLSYISDRVRAVLGAERGDPVGRPLAEVFELDQESARVSRTLGYLLTAKSAFADYPVRNAGAPGSGWWSISGQPRRDAEGEFRGFTGSGTDLTEKRKSQAAITRLAYSDGLTGLANRERMTTTLEQFLTVRTSGFQPTALFLLDLDRFKTVNDTLGHQTGDELLKQVAHRLQRMVGEAGVVGRLGGDEFEVVIAHDDVRGRLDALARDVIHSLSQPYIIADQPISIGCSIGIAVAPEHGQTGDHLIRNADLALYAAKEGGRGLHRVYTDDLLAEARHRKQLEDDLREALALGQLSLAYQPVVSTRDQRIVGYEALLRWTHPERGPVSPAAFIPVAEECGLIASIGEWVLRTAVADAAGWPAPIRVAVNVSPTQFASPHLPSVVANALAASGLPPERLELEITESVFLNEDEQAQRMFKALKGIGVRLALDDFGTGYSSLGYLKTAPFDKIKIDQSFVRGAIMAGNRNAAIIKAIVTLAETLGLETTAEGVEQQDEIAFVRDLGCSHIQGFVYGKPAPVASVVGHLAEHGASAVPIGHKVSREPRERVIRSARLTMGEQASDVVVRNISGHGAMIEGSPLTEAALGVDVLIELLEGRLWSGNVRWVNNGRVGVHFARRLDDDLLVPTRS